MTKTMASTLKNRVEIWREEIISDDIGDTKQDVFIKKVWGKLSPNSLKSLSQGEAETKNSQNQYKLLFREGIDIRKNDFIRFKNQDYYVDYTIPYFNDISYREAYLTLKVE